MDLFSELITAVQSDLTIVDGSSLYPLATVKLAINRAYRKAGGLYRWPELEDAQVTSTQAGVEYYDYPQTWRPNSAWKLLIGGNDYYDPLVFKDYLYEKENDIPSGADYLWANQHRRFFVYPTPTANGSSNMSVWGIKNVSTLTNNTDITIFSYSMPECNEAIVLEAGAILRSKGEDENRSQFRSAEALRTLTIAWGKIKQEKAKYEKTQPFFDVIDMFGPTKASEIGNF